MRASSTRRWGHACPRPQRTGGADTQPWHESVTGAHNHNHLQRKAPAAHQRVPLWCLLFRPYQSQWIRCFSRVVLSLCLFDTTSMMIMLFSRAWTSTSPSTTHADARTLSICFYMRGGSISMRSVHDRATARHGQRSAAGPRTRHHTLREHPTACAPITSVSGATRGQASIRTRSGGRCRRFRLAVNRTAGTDAVPRLCVRCAR